ncbi:hypothetical protein ACSVDE_06465 [Pseudalkalibacillus sp. Hm43]|uniref:hypothetical protein n=1 Tax=Pseudalkalibacillus sp. Hm43 TaxID=3450742 RepID=UPI003F434B6A
MLLKLIRNPWIVFSFIGLTVLLTLSFGYEAWLKYDGERVTILYDEEGLPYDSAPFEPSLEYPLGSDNLGENYLYRVIDGAKYTIALAAIISLIQMILSFFGGFLLYLSPKKARLTFDGLFDTLHYAPFVIFIYLLVGPVLVIFTWSYTLETKIVFPAVVIIFLSVPVLSNLIAKELEQVYKVEFIQNAPTLGGGVFHIFRKHVSRFLVPKMFVLFLQQISTVLIIFVHLGILQVFIGGSETYKMDERIEGKEVVIITESFTMSNEWGGLIGKYWSEYMFNPMLVFGPILGFSFVILMMNLLVHGLTQTLEINPYVKKKRERKSRLRKKTATELDFTKI